MARIGTRFITIKSDDIDKFRESFSDNKIFTPDFIQRTLEETAKEIIRSIEIGFIKQRDPEGRPWKKNPKWWRRIKGHEKANIGVPVGMAQSGIWQVEQSKKHMKDSLKYTIKMGKESGLSREAVIEYEPAARKRAKDTQEGRVVRFTKKNKITGSEFTYLVKVVKRPHMGLATWARHPMYGTDDVGVAAHIWGDAISDAIERFISKL
jgi:hypothetical protein